MARRAGRRGQKGVLRLAFVYAALLGSMILVVRRQSRALDELRGLDESRRERAVLEATRAELVRGLERLESRAHVVGFARRELGMHIPATDEIVLLRWRAGGSDAADEGVERVASPRPSRAAVRDEDAKRAEAAG